MDKNLENSMPLEVFLEIERIDLLYRQNILGLIVLNLFGSSYLLVVWGAVPLRFLIAWASLLYASSICRALLTICWRRIKFRITEESQARRWLFMMQAMLLVSGVSWGIIGWLMPTMANDTAQIVTCLVVVMMAAGSMLAYSASLASMLLVFIPALGPWALALWLTGDASYRLMAGMIGVYGLLGLRGCRNLNRYVLRSLRLTIENAQLARNLERQIQSKDRARDALRESEDRLKFAIEASDAVTWTWLPNTGEFSCEGSLLALFGLPSGSWRTNFDEFVGHVHCDDREALTSKLNAAIAGNQDIGQDREVEFRVRRPDGAIRHVGMRGRVLCPQLGCLTETPRASGIMLDITDKKQREFLVREAHEHEVANKAKSVLLANVSHEIRTPLAAINGFTDLLLRDSDLPEEARRDIEIIHRNGKYLVSLVGDLLDLSRIESGQIYIESNRVSVIREVNEIISLMLPLIRSRGLGLEVVFETKQPEFIETDVVRFREVLINLINNAAKFTERGGIRVGVSFRNAEDGSGHLRVVVRDSGIGISAAERKGLFQPFMRGENEHVQKVHGSGLGLALSRRLARLMGGDLALLRSEIGEGSEFEFTLVTAAAHELFLSEDLERNSSGTSKSEQAAPFRDRSILVVDDSLDLLVLMRRFFEARGAQVETRENGAEALAILQERTFDLVLMDIKMPVMDGYAAASKLRRRRYAGPVVALTAHASADDRLLCYQAGFDSYISKPVDFQNLTAELFRVITDRRYDAGQFPAFEHEARDMSAPGSSKDS